MLNSSKLLRDKGVKITPHKLTILEALNEHKHLDAARIQSLLQQNSIIISTATIYRILSEFEHKNIITKLNFNNDQATYEINDHSTHHDHLICSSCGHVIEFNSQEIEDLQIAIATQNNFKVTHHSLNIYGICHECQLNVVEYKVKL